MCMWGGMVNLNVGCTHGTHSDSLPGVLTHLDRPSFHPAPRQTQGRKVNGPQLHCLRAGWQGLQRVLGRVPTPAAWRERKRDYNRNHRVIPCPVPAGTSLSQSCLEKTPV